MTRLLLPLLCVMLGVLVTDAGAQSRSKGKVVGIIFDDSGSMGRSYRLPTYGMQLLAATIDGRDGKDQLLTMNLKRYAAPLQAVFSRNNKVYPPLPDISTIRDRAQQFGGINQLVRRERLRTQTEHQRTVNNLADVFVSKRGSGTPYGPIELMLDQLATVTDEGEDAYLIVVSDGDYNDNETGPSLFSPERLKESYRQHRSRFTDGRKGALRVEYLFIKRQATTPEEIRDIRDLMEKLEAQGVRDGLLEVFNGLPEGAEHGPEGGSHIVSGGDDLWRALRDIIARVSRTDRSGQSAYVQYSGNSISFSSPLSISRVVVVSNARGGADYPVIQQTSFPRRPESTRNISVTMSGSDDRLGNLRMNGSVTHFWFPEALQPKQHEVIFDRAIGDDAFLLFETQAITTIRVLTPDGQEVARNTDGSYRLFRGKPYVVAAYMEDLGPGNVTKVTSLDAFPDGLRFDLTLDGPGGRQDHSMGIDVAADRSVHDWMPDTAGDYLVRAQSHIPGFISPSSQPVAIQVIDSAASVSIGPITSVTDCPSCGPDELRAEVLPDAPSTRLGTFEISSTAQIDGAVRISVEDLPGYLRVVDEIGNPVDGAAEIPMDPQGKLTFGIELTGDFTGEDLADADKQIAMKFEPAGDWTGDVAEREFRVVLSAPELKMKLIRMSRERTPGTLDALVVNDAELRKSRFSGTFALDEIAIAPSPERIDRTFSVAYHGTLAPLLDFDLRLSDASSSTYGVDVTPQTQFWCLCYIGIGNAVLGDDERELTLRYEDELGLQTAEAKLPMAFPISSGPMTWSCLLNLLILFLLIVFIRGLFALLLTKRFPRGSVLEVTEGSNVPRYVQLRGSNYTWLRCWFALFTGNPDERCNAEGLSMRAIRQGALLDLTRSAPRWYLERMGQSFEEMKEYQKNLEEFRLIWGDRFESLDNSRNTMRLKLRSTDV